MGALWVLIGLPVVFYMTLMSEFIAFAHNFGSCVAM
jgi:hypothetical protein